MEETRRFGNVLLKLNVTSSKNENGDDATVSVDTVSLEGGGDGGAVARTGRGQFTQVRQTRGPHFPLLPRPGDQALGSQAAGAGDSGEWLICAQLTAHHGPSSTPRALASTSSTPLRG